MTTIDNFKVTGYAGVKEPGLPGIKFDNAAIALVERFKKENPGLQKFEMTLSDGSKLSIKIPKPRVANGGRR